MKRFILLLSAIVIIAEAKNLASGVKIYEILQDQNGAINIKPISTNVNFKARHPKPKFVDNSDSNVIELFKHVLSQLKHNEYDSGHDQDDLPLEESLFLDQTREMTSQNNILLHLLAPKQLSKKINNLPEENFPAILRIRGNDRTLAPPPNRYRYAEDD